MRRADVYLANLDPAPGSEANKVRPVIIVSSDAKNRTTQNVGRGTITVVPITSNVNRVYTFQVFVPVGIAGLHVESKVQPEQIRAISIERLGRRLGHLPIEIMKAVDDALRLHLSL